LTGVVIRPVASADAADLLRFELAHRAYFERWINARDPSFYGERGVASAIPPPTLGGQWFDRLLFERHAISCSRAVANLQRA
jgi:hypothetical protein